MQVSIWPGGLPSSAEGTVEWAGGLIQWNEPEYVENGYYWNTLKSVSVQCWEEGNQTSGTTGWAYAGNNSENVPVSAPCCFGTVSDRWAQAGLSGRGGAGKHGNMRTGKQRDRGTGEQGNGEQGNRDTGKKQGRQESLEQEQAATGKQRTSGIVEQGSREVEVTLSGVSPVHQRVSKVAKRGRKIASACELQHESISTSARSSCSICCAAGADDQTVFTTNASTLLNAGHRTTGIVVDQKWMAAAGFVGGALLAGLSVL